MPLIEYDGRLAFTFGWQDNWADPKQTRTIHVSGGKVRDWQHVLDLNIPDSSISWTGSVGVVRHYALPRPVVLDVTGWMKILEERPVKKPRRGKGYDWRWLDGRWQKEYIFESDQSSV